MNDRYFFKNLLERMITGVIRNLVGKCLCSIPSTHIRPGPGSTYSYTSLLLFNVDVLARYFPHALVCAFPDTERAGPDPGAKSTSNKQKLLVNQLHLIREEAKVCLSRN